MHFLLHLDPSLTSTLMVAFTVMPPKQSVTTTMPTHRSRFLFSTGAPAWLTGSSLPKRFLSWWPPRLQHGAAFSGWGGGRNGDEVGRFCRPGQRQHKLLAPISLLVSLRNTYLWCPWPMWLYPIPVTYVTVLLRVWGLQATSCSLQKLFMVFFETSVKGERPGGLRQDQKGSGRIL